MIQARRVWVTASVLAFVSFTSAAEAQSTAAVVEPPNAEAQPSNTPTTTRGARAELVVTQTIHGMGAAAEVCAIASCDSARVWAGATLLGAGLGLTLSLALTRDGITPSLAYGINAGTFLGAWHGYALYGAISPLYADDGGGNALFHGTFAAMLGGQALGITAGWLIDRTLQPTVGEMAFATGLAGWATGISAMVGSAIAIWRDELTDTGIRAFHGALLAVTDLGLVLGGLLASHVHPSRGRTLVMHAGGALGGGLAPLTAWLIGGDDMGPGGYLLSSAIGATVGLGLTYFLTRNFDAEGPPVDISLAPLPGGATATLRMTL